MDEHILDGFVDGFSKAAEDAGFRGEQVKTLMQLSLDLAQREGHKEAFDSGFSSVLRGA